MLLDGIIAYLENQSAYTTLVTGGTYRSVLPRGYTLPVVCVHRYGGVSVTGTSAAWIALSVLSWTVADT